MREHVVITNIQISTTLRPSRVKAAALFVLCLVFVLGGIWMVLDGKRMGYFCGGFFALGLPVFALQFHPKASYLRLTSDCFTFCSLFRSHTVRWKHVREFGVIRIASNHMVAWNFTPDYPAAKRGRALSKSLSGYESALPDTYGMNAQELTELMDTLRQQHQRGSSI